MGYKHDRTHGRTHETRKKTHLMRLETRAFRPLFLLPLHEGCQSWKVAMETQKIRVVTRDELIDHIVRDLDLEGLQLHCHANLSVTKSK